MLRMAGDARLHGRKLGPPGEKALFLNGHNATAACMSGQSIALEGNKYGRRIRPMRKAERFDSTAIEISLIDISQCSYVPHTERPMLNPNATRYSAKVPPAPSMGESQRPQISNCILMSSPSLHSSSLTFLSSGLTTSSSNSSLLLLWSLEIVAAFSLPLGPLL
jgi:hypothetical protein